MRLNNFYRYIINNHYLQHKGCILYGNNADVCNFYVEFFKNYHCYQNFKLKYIDNLEELQKIREGSLFESINDNKIYIYSNIVEREFKQLLKIIPYILPGTFLFLVAKGFNTKSSFVKHFSENDQLSAVPCYASNSSYLEDIMQYSIQKKELPLNMTQSKMIVEHYLNNSNVFFNDLQKIKLFLSNTKGTTDNHIKLLLNNSVSNLLLNEISQNFLLCNVKKVLQLMDNINSSRSILVTIRYITKQMCLLQELLSHYHFKKDINKAMVIMQNKIFFYEQDLFRKALKLWNIQKLKKILDFLINAEKDYKDNNLTLTQFKYYLCQLLAEN